MTSHIGLAFSNERITFAHFVAHNGEKNMRLFQTGTIEYPFKYEPVQFYNRVNVPNIGTLLRQTFNPIENNQLFFSVSIETNLAIIKRIAYPIDFDEKEQNLHISWEIKESLPGSIADYVYLRTDNRKSTQSIIEELLIIIPKKIIEFINAVTEYAQIKLKSLSLHSLSAEVAVRKLLGEDIDDLILLFKRTRSYFETIILYQGEYYNSFYDPFDANEKRNSDDIILERLKARIDAIEKLLAQYQFQNCTVGHIYMYGESIDDELLEKIRKNISIQVDRINPIEKVAKTDEYLLSPEKNMNHINFVECIGVALDQ